MLGAHTFLTNYGFKTRGKVSFVAKLGPFLALAGAVLLMIPWPFCISVRLPNQITVSKREDHRLQKLQLFII